VEKWQEQVEEILSKQFPEDVSTPFPDLVKNANKMLNMLIAAGPPSGDIGLIIPEVIKLASKSPSLRFQPLLAIHVGFHLGMAWESFERERNNRAK